LIIPISVACKYPEVLPDTLCKLLVAKNTEIKIYPEVVSTNSNNVENKNKRG
jgi:hypothetical protein